MKLKKISPKLFFVIKLIVTLVLCYVIIKNVDWANIWESLKNTNIYWITAAFILMILNVYVSAYKWKIHLDVHKINFSFNQLSKFYYIGAFFNNFLPTTVGGDGYRVYKTFQDDKSKAGPFVAVVMERVTGMIALIILGVIGAVIAYISDKDQLSEYLLLAGSGILLVLLVAVLAVKYKGEKLKELSLKYLPQKMNSLIERLTDYKGQTYNIFLIVLISVIFNLMLIASRIFLLFSVNETCTFFQMAIVLAGSNIIALIPISINGIGLRDGSFVYLLTYYGVSYDPSVLVAVLIRILNIPLSLIGGLYYLGNKSSKIEKVTNKEFQSY